ncbi:MAG: hypothetical protein ABI612_19020, partial [Betaproteobacteria bacterium]
WVVYVGWDIWHAWKNEVFASVFTIVLSFRVAGTIALAIWVWLIFKPSFRDDETYATLLLAGGVVLAYVLLLGMIHVVPFPYNYLYYYVGLLIELLFLFGFLRLRAKPAFILVATLLALSAMSFRIDVDYHLLAVEATVRDYYWADALSYLASFVVVGCAIAVELERKARQTFYRERELETRNAAMTRQNEDLAKLNIALEDARHDTETKTQALMRAKEDSRV